MFKGTQPVLEAFKMSNKPHYKMYYNVVKAGGQLPCFESDASGDAGTNYIRLDEYFKLNLAPGKYLIQFKQQLDDTGGVSVLFEIPGAGGTSPAISGLQQQPAMGYSQDSFTQLLDAKIGQVQKDYELKLLQKDIEKERAELAELRKSDNALNNFLTNWAPMLVQVISARFGGMPAGAQTGIAGFTNTNQQQPFAPQQETTNQQQQTVTVLNDDDKAAETQLKLEEVLTWLAKEEGDSHKAVDLLYKMKQKAESNPALLGMLKTFLN